MELDTNIYQHYTHRLFKIISLIVFKDHNQNIQTKQFALYVVLAGKIEKR